MMCIVPLLKFINFDPLFFIAYKEVLILRGEISLHLLSSNICIFYNKCI